MNCLFLIIPHFYHQHLQFITISASVLSALLTHEYWPASVTLVSLMMSFLFLPSSLICTLHVSYSRLEETGIFFSRIRSEKGKKKINRHSPLVRYDLLVTFEPFYLSAGIVQLADQRQRFFFNELLRFQHLHEFVRVFCAEETNKFSLFLFRLENFN